ncbi:MAG: N-6 DNA methylase, partial [Chitinivibrionales bacterium]|nr:N-6 DNA methylase [Chitinivibrionales bacterium]
MRRLDESDRKRKEDAEWLKKEYQSFFSGSFAAPDGTKIEKEHLRWSHFRHLPGDEMLSHVRDKVFPFIKNLGDGDHPFSRYMQDAVFIIPKASLLVEAVGIIDNIYNEIERERQDKGQTFHDTQGDLYEYLLSETSSAGKNGQFRTPRHIIQMMCALVDPKLGDEVCDPACGTGGFLLGAYQHILTQHTSKELCHTDENGMVRGLVGDKLTDDRQWQVLRERTFNGYDFDTTMVRIGLMNLILHGIDRPKLGYKDTLSKNFDEKDCYDVVLANPPFKGSIDKGDINEELSLKTTKTELLFVNRIIDLLRIGGRAAVIVPDGVLFGSSNAHRSLRQMLVEKCELQGVVSMPSGVFRPYASVSTAVLMFVKGGRTENVWFYGMAADGYSLDDKRASIPENDIPDIIKTWKTIDDIDRRKMTDRSRNHFLVPVEEIVRKNYDLSMGSYKKIEYKEVEYEPPAVILGRMKKLEEEIVTGIEELEALIQ